ALRTDGSTLYAGGSFTSVGGLSRPHLAALAPTSGVPIGWNPGPDDDVRTISILGNNIFIGGTFLHLGGLERLGCAMLLSEGSILEWNPGLSQGNRVYASAFSSSGVYVGGDLPLEFKAGFGSHALAAFPPEGFPVIIQGPLDEESKVGKTFSFSVQASGELPLFYFWALNGSTVLSNNAAILNGVAQAGGSAVYQVTVSNRLGIASARATLTVLEPVAIATQPLSQNASMGDNVTFSVQASGGPSPVYQWRVNGVNIPGAVFPTLTLSNVSPASGGSYYAVVGNRVGAIDSDVAVLTIADAALPFGDNLSGRGTINGFFGSGIGNNSAATREINEPNHAQKAGGKSLWLSWTAPASGIATISTRGSAFDTLLAVYTGSSITNLVVVASDEDRGGYLTSQVDFNAAAGVEYLIAVDGLAGASGPIVLTWSLDSTTTPFPRINGQPLSESVSVGGVATFAVQASGTPPLTYQWFFGCRQLQDATNSSLTISNVGLHQVGAYRVFVMNGSTKIAESLPASLELSSAPGVLSFDKIEDLLNSGTSGTNGFGPSKQASFVGGAPPLLVSMGTIISQTFDTTSGSGFIKETNHCGVIGGASAWIRFQPTQDGTVLVDTIGSLFDTVLAIYRDTNLTVLATNPGAALVDCDNNGAPDDIRSQLKFKTKANEVYLAVVDGVLSAKGIANIDWQLGTKPTNIISAVSVTGTFGKSVTLSSGILSTTLKTAYQWFCNGTPILGATNSALLLTNLMVTNAGIYTVSASNFAGTVLNDAAHLAIDIPLRLDPILKMNAGQLQATVWGNPTQSFILQASTNLQNWVSISTNTVQANPTTVFDPGSGQFRNRFYRVRSYP
ncbi:MAG: Matrixin, partial [Verrucomicrobiales bacterium]|nr:Matrixin [Verrucomicrobiales bacterium]